MSRDLRIAFCGEGNTDSRVVPVFIEKIIGELATREPINLTIATQSWDLRLRFPEAVAEVVRQSQPLYHLVVAHLDADAADESHVRAQKVIPAEQALAEAQLSTPLLVWAIPVQAIEAWLLASSSSFALALTQRSDRAHEVAFPNHPERIHRDEAKQLYTESVYQLLASTSRKRRRIRPEQFMSTIAIEVALTDMRRLPSFRRFEDSLERALRDLGYLLSGN